MDKLKELFLKINAKAPIVKILFGLTLAGGAFTAYSLIDLFTFEPNFLVLYGLEDAGTVRARVEEQMRRYKPKPPPPVPPPPQKPQEVGVLGTHNPFTTIPEVEGVKGEEKITDVTGIELIGTVYSYTRERRTALIELNGIALVVAEGKHIRGTQKKVVEIGRSKIAVQEDGLLPSNVYLPQEFGLDDLSRALAANQYKTQSNWEYDVRGGGKATRKAAPAEGEEGAEGQPAEETEEKKPKKSKPSKTDEEIAAEEAAAEEEEEEEQPAEEPSSTTGAENPAAGVDLGGGE